MKNALRNMPLRKKFYTLICLMILIPVLLAGIVTDYAFISRFQEQERNVALNAFLQVRNNISYLLGEVENISLALLYDDSIQSLYRELVRQTGKENVAVLRRNVSKSVSSLVLNRPYISAVLVTSGEEKLFEFGEAVVRENPHLYDAAVAGLGRPVWTQGQLQDTVRVNNGYYVSMLRAISDLNAYGHVIAVERISFTEDMLSNALQEMNVYAGSSAVICSRDGLVVAATDKLLLGGNLRDKSVFSQTMQDGRMSGYVAGTQEDQGKTHLFFRLSEPDWIVVQTVDDANFRTQMVALAVLMAGAMLFCLMFAFAYSIVIGRTVLAPIRRLHSAMEQVSGGELDIEVPCNSNDEIGQLSKQFEHMVGELKALIETRYKHQILLREAELRNLQSQINPHFLYNTLDAIHWLAVRNGDMEVCEQIEALSDLFRHVLNKGEEMTTIGEELQHLKNYLLLQKTRYGEKIQVDMDVDDKLFQTEIPKLMIQPLVENAIYHGLEHKVGTGSIHLLIKREDQDVLIVVEDNGVGTRGAEISRRLHDDTSDGLLALRNINERLRWRYGEEYGVRFMSEPGCGTRVVLRFAATWQTGGDQR